MENYKNDNLYKNDNYEDHQHIMGVSWMLKEYIVNSLWILYEYIVNVWSMCGIPRSMYGIPKSMYGMFFGHVFEWKMLSTYHFINEYRFWTMI